METHLGLTPFGRQQMTHALLAMRRKTQQIPQGAAIDKWQLHRWLCEAKSILDINDRSLAVLSALLSFYPENTLNEKTGLVVFPSNRQLALRAHGMADATLRRHLAALVEAGIIARHDSPNGKRYARRSKSGELQVAFGFSLAPLLARAEEFETAAEQVKAEKAALREMRENLTLLRRDIAKLLEFAFAENLPGDWIGINARFRAIVDAIPRRAEPDDLKMLVAALDDLRAEIDNTLNINEKIEKMSGNESQNERQLNESNPDSHFEKPFATQDRTSALLDEKSNHEPAVSLDMVLRACPMIETCAASPIHVWQDLIDTAEKTRKFLGIRDNLYDFTTKMLGRCNTAIVIAYILQRHEHIASAGGYLRILAEKAADNGFSIRPLMMSAFNSQMKGHPRSLQ